MPTLFSEREGIIEKELQVGYINKNLRTRLWNCLERYYWKYIKKESLTDWKTRKYRRDWGYFPYLAKRTQPSKEESNRLERPLREYRKIGKFIHELWDSYFRLPLNKLREDWTEDWKELYEMLENYFFGCEWYEVYDFLEFVVNNWPDQERNREFMECCNRVLEEENAGYRFINGMIVPIFEKTEISEIETAFENVKPWKGVYDDLFSALKHLSDREHPNYKDSVVASIRAVEGVAKLITHRHGTLGELMPKVQQVLELDEHFAKAIGQLWRYTNTVARHSDPEGEKMPEFEEAKFVLVTSCAIINYLITKANKKGVELKLE
ncbi:hypothetical protein PAP_06645 [Palaeococcus pacificus DY20341]|uniref:HEPN AbiJ-N-terminal domain-containing protein n=2 Tax=Palaeococcus TaxID=83867 RepID=A0A075LTN5_9EURY|nr:hypothetical protein PAP_06645 [Palaeococcus pacificus DY20341]